MKIKKFDLKMIRLNFLSKKVLCYVLKDLESTEVVYMTNEGIIIYNDVECLLPEDLKVYHVCSLTSKLKYIIIGLFKDKGIL